MDIERHLKIFSELGDIVNNITDSMLDELHIHAQNENNWFTRENIELGVKGVGKYLDETELKKWLEKYDFNQSKSLNVGIIMAGNIPLVGFHDLLCVLVSGHNAWVKMSSQDVFLMNWIIGKLKEISPELSSKIKVVDRLNDADAVIATGSDNTARYFNYYFGKKPHIIRKNRTSLAILTGDESGEDLQQLGRDIFTYFGLGCRNVSKVMVPAGYSFEGFFKAVQSYEKVIDHHKYRNNYDYNKSIYLVNKHPHLDNGFLLVTQSDELVSPISVLYYQEYENSKDLDKYLADNEDKLQCVVSKNGKVDHISMGNSQTPHVWEYADGVDTLAFLIDL